MLENERKKVDTGIFKVENSAALGGGNNHVCWE